MDNQNRAAKRSKYKIILLILLATVFVAVAAGVINKTSKRIVSAVSEDLSNQYSKELNSQMTSHTSSSLHHYFDEMNLIYHSLSLMENVDTEELQVYIQKICESNDIVYLAFADSDGYLYEADCFSLGTLKIHILGELLNGYTNIVSDNETINNQSLVLLGTSYPDPFYVDGKAVSMIIAGVSNDKLNDEVVLNNDYSGGFSSIINADGSYVVKNTSTNYGGLNAFSILASNGLTTEAKIQEIKQAIENKETYMLTVDDPDGSAVAYLYLAPVEGTDWYTLNTLPASFIRSSVDTLNNAMTGIAFAMIGIAVLVAAVVVVMQGISQRKLSDNQILLEDALAKAEQASQSKTSFLFNMSHDIRTPMNAILGYTDIGLSHAGDTVQTVNSFNKIKIAGNHLLSLINDILEMSRIEAGKLELVEKELDIRKAIDGVDIMSKALAVPKSIDFQTVVGDIHNPYIFADELHVNEVIINLISNAVKYTPNGGKVRYTVNQVGDAIDGKATFRFEVADNGIGMSEAFQKRLFEAFSRESNSTVSKTEGAGLGLSIVKKIVELAGGTVKAVSKQGEGSTFTAEMSFKIMNDEEIAAFEKTNSVEVESHDAAALEGIKVLLVEDNEINREIAEMILSDYGILVEQAEDGSVAVKTVKEKGADYYDFVLMDIQMPVMDGYAATKAIRELPDGEKVRIIALSANAFEEDKRKSLESGMNAHVAKPLNTAELFEVMSQLL